MCIYDKYIKYNINIKANDITKLQTIYITTKITWFGNELFVL